MLRSHSDLPTPPASFSASAETPKSANRIVTSIGYVCVLATFLLMSGGVQSVQAESPAALAPTANTNPAVVGAEANRSVDPVLEEKSKTPSAAPVPVAPIVSAGDKAAVERGGVAGYEVQPGVIVLNTQGYNYAPRSGSLDPKALALEAAEQR